MTKLGVRLVNINIARHSKVGHFANHPLGQQDISGGQVPVDNLVVRNSINNQKNNISNLTFSPSRYAIPLLICHPKLRRILNLSEDCWAVFEVDSLSDLR